MIIEGIGEQRIKIESPGPMLYMALENLAKDSFSQNEQAKKKGCVSNGRRSTHRYVMYKFGNHLMADDMSELVKGQILTW